MRSILGIILVSITLICSICFQAGCSKPEASQSVAERVDSTVAVDESNYDEEDSGQESLNDIRFADFQEEDWFDNEYIRALRHFLDELSDEDIMDETLEPYRAAMKGKFVIYSVEPALMGGMFIMFTFIDAPESVFSTWVYSEVNEKTGEVNEKTGEVTNYEVQGIKLEDIKNELSREEILQVVNERPELKLF